MKSEKLSEYIKSDGVHNTREKLHEAAGEVGRLSELPAGQRDNNLIAQHRERIRELQRAVEEAEAKEATVNSIIISTILFIITATHYIFYS